MEYAFEGEELTGTGNPSVFTSPLSRGSNGEADRDQDHRISIEGSTTSCGQVREIARDQTRNMLSHLEGELYLARSSYVAPVSAADCPPTRHAIDSPLPACARGSSASWRACCGPRPGRRRGGRGALGHLAEDDSRGSRPPPRRRSASKPPPSRPSRRAPPPGRSRSRSGSRSRSAEPKRRRHEAAPSRVPPPRCPGARPLGPAYPQRARRAPRVASLACSPASRGRSRCA